MDTGSFDNSVIHYASMWGCTLIQGIEILRSQFFDYVNAIVCKGRIIVLSRKYLFKSLSTKNAEYHFIVDEAFFVTHCLFNLFTQKQLFCSSPNYFHIHRVSELLICLRSVLIRNKPVLL